ncbi:hypothetical protein NKL07_20890 [Mesorhizobium sp. C280B]|uniref:hypothetical protein n=1 Tax=unclassified Mesorhizobium TaxID=325217 RepID=UPI0003CE6CC2|nr:hypothetical protein [Mesorhizobium sp. LSJC280B00]ESW92884.1 hypothetical protein X772_01915 [Mesorhizobium sp. LSJC280B00]
MHFSVPGHARQLLDLGNAIDADEFGDDEFSHGDLLMVKGRTAPAYCDRSVKKYRGALLGGGAFPIRFQKTNTVGKSFCDLD